MPPLSPETSSFHFPMAHSPFHYAIILPPPQAPNMCLPFIFNPSGGEKRGVPPVLLRLLSQLRYLPQISTMIETIPLR